MPLLEASAAFFPVRFAVLSAALPLKARFSALALPSGLTMIGGIEAAMPTGCFSQADASAVGARVRTDFPVRHRAAGSMYERSDFVVVSSAAGRDCTVAAPARRAWLSGSSRAGRR